MQTHPKSTFRCALFLILFSISTPARAQTPPGDLTELSLEQILGLQIVRRSVTTNAENIVVHEDAARWSIGYRYIHVFFSGHRRGTDSLLNGEVLGPANGVTFPIIPTNIRQEAHTFELGYRATERLSFTMLAPYIFQSTEHISLAPGFANFTIGSDGIGDVSLTPSYRIWESGNHAVILNSGLSLPIGSINQTGDTPGPGPVNALPYTMQIGSGTFDALPGIAYQGSKDRLRWSLQALATIRLGRNYRGYTLGNRYALAGHLSYALKPWFEPIFGLRFQNWQRITGADPNLPAGPPYPATVADPSRYGGEKINLAVGTRFKITGGPLTGSAMEIQGALPVYQRLNGPQPEEQWQLNAAWKWSF